MSETANKTNIPEEFIAAEVERSTHNLAAVAQLDSIGERDRSQLRDRIQEVTDLVESSPDRLEADRAKHPTQRTEYDIHRAHIAAIAIDKASTFIAHDKQTRGNKPMSTKRERAELHVRQWEKLANEIYDEDPLHIGPNRIELEKQDQNKRIFRGPEF